MKAKMHKEKGLVKEKLERTYKIINKLEKESELQDMSTEKERFKKCNDNNWKEYVLKHYKELREEFDSLSIKLLPINKIEIKIINPVEHDLFRVYAILTELVLDVIIEFKIELDDHQKMMARNNWTRVLALTNEKSRWVSAGTSLISMHTKERLLNIGTYWSNESFADVLRIVTYKLHQDVESRVTS